MTPTFDLWPWKALQQRPFISWLFVPNFIESPPLSGEISSKCVYLATNSCSTEWQCFSFTVYKFACLLTYLLIKYRDIASHKTGVNGRTDDQKTQCRLLSIVGTGGMTKILNNNEQNNPLWPGWHSRQSSDCRVYKALAVSEAQYCAGHYKVKSTRSLKHTTHLLWPGAA